MSSKLAQILISKKLGEYLENIHTDKVFIERMADSLSSA
jgi:hypothetical protein